MSTARSKEILLSVAINHELEDLGGKLKHYGITPPEGTVLYQSEKPLTLEQVFTLIDPNDPEIIKNPDLKLLYGLGWEFIWGKPAPQWVTDFRESVAIKVRFGLAENDLEILWYNLILTDTDWF